MKYLYFSLSIVLIFFFFILVNYYFIPVNNPTKKGYIHPKYFETFYQTLTQKKYIYWISAISRLTLPLYLFNYLHPCTAMILNQVVVDNIDPIFLLNVNSPFYNRKQYYQWDKLFDLWGYLI